MPSITSCPESDYAPSWLPDGGPGIRFAITPLVPADPGNRSNRNSTNVSPSRGRHDNPPAGRVSIQSHAAQCHHPLVPPTPRTCRVAVQDTPALPGYKILEVLGRGGMATVYKARQLGTKRLVAVKVIDRSLAGDEEIVARFRQEQALGARLRHPNLIAVYRGRTRRWPSVSRHGVGRGRQPG